MTRLLVLAAVVAAATAGVARADVFTVVPAGEPAASTSLPLLPSALPSAELPNASGTVAAVPFGGVAQQLAYPQLVDLWQRAGAAYGIPWQVLGAINKVESNFGRNMGPSSAGAVGWMQFMPSTWERWGTDANQDGVADPWNAEDAIFSAARYLAAAGGRSDIARGVFAYNHAQWYVDEVLQLAGVMTDLGVDATFSIDRRALRIAEAQERVAAVNQQLLAAQEADRRLAIAEQRLLGRTDSAELLSDQLALRARAVQAGLRSDRASAATERLEEKLERAEKALERARTSTAGSAFAPSTATLSGAPAVQGSYVFPVAGGPSVVSVAHTHHDYPAADIAAPEGTQLYVLTDGTVTSAWRLPDPLCGIGFKLQAADGQEYVYCHLSYIEPGIVEGAPVSAGQAAGLVGHTGHATGPHLHLGLKPSIAYPQELPWFQSFAGRAFRWQDAPTPDAPALFAIVPTPDAGVITFTTG